MVKDTLTLLEEEVEKLMDELESYDVGTDEYKARLDAVTKLTDRIRDLKKIEVEEKAEHSKLVIDENLRQDQFEKELTFKKEQFEKELTFKKEQIEEELTFKKEQLEEQIEARKNEEMFKLKQAKIDRNLRWIQNGITIGLGVLSIGVSVWGTNKTLKFEETGTVTTNAGRNWINSLFKIKK